MLAIDRDGDSRIRGVDELLASDPQAARGRARNSLKWLDANGGGILDRNDPAFAALRIWLDANGNAVSETTELVSLREVGITAIDFREPAPTIVDA